MNKKQIINQANMMHDNRINYLNGQIKLLKDDIKRAYLKDDILEIEKLDTRIELLQLLKAGAPETILNLLK